MKNKRVFVSVLCFILILTVSVIPTGLAAGAATDDFDYSKPGSNNTVFTSADLLEYIDNDILLSEGERAYLSQYGTFKLSYESVTNQQITIVNTESITQITARPYSYTAANGKELTWIPKSVSVDGISGELVLDNGSYVATFDSSPLNESSTVDVTYELEGIPAIPASKVNEILNLVYDKALGIKDEFEAYESAKNAYDTYFSENHAVIEKYYSDIGSYNQYLRDVFIYSEKKEVFDSYLDALEKYKQDCDDFEEYEKKLKEYNDAVEHNLNYPDDYAKFEQDQAKYEEYLSQLAIVDEQIKVLDDGLFLKATYLDRQLYSSLFSSLVDEVIAANKQIYITTLGIDEQVIDDCIEASDDIRAILEPKNGKHYKKLKTIEEKYDFYVNYRDELRDAIIKLTCALHELYSNNALREMMHFAPEIVGRSDYTEKLSIFISQLILFSNALSDETVMSFDGSMVLDKNTKFSYWNEAGVEIKNRSAIDILEGNEYIKDSGNAAPISGGYPTEVKEPTEPQLIDPLPDKPEDMSRPIEPEYVEEPDEPEVVYEPTPPAGFIEEPTKPKDYDNIIYKQIVSDLDSGLITEREEVSEDVKYTPSATLTKRIYSTEAVTVTFTDGKGEVVSTVSVDKGTAVNFIGEIPTKAEDFSATYTFYAWTDSEGNIFDLSKVDEDVTLYPLFSPSYKEYDIEYNVNGTNKNRISVFLPDMTLDYLPITSFAELANEHFASLRVSAGNVTLELSYSSLMDLDKAGVSYLDVIIDTATAGIHSYNFIAFDDEGKTVDITSRIEVTIPCPDSTFAKDSLLTYADGEQIKYVDKTYSGSAVCFSAATNRSYTMTVRYIINVSSSVSNVVTAPENALPGQTVSLDLNVPLGTVLDLYYVLESDSKTKHTIEGASFVMPSEAIRIGGRITTIDYIIIFVSDGKEISNKVYKYGDTVRIPNNPIKLSDGEYSYKFMGWSPEVLSTVTDNCTYVAQFERTPLPVVEEEFPWFTVIFYTAITLFTLGAVTLVIFILDKKGVINVKEIIQFIKHKLSRVGGVEQPTDPTTPLENDVFEENKKKNESENETDTPEV